ncbi:ankyrin repeat domain-containing protein 1-like [Chelonus insularis]|uniref:ankyrin repeat domain-containing protein 1-like n=1 Tax=Chelonus insularis TaxID=460826 RepID=UPI00158C8FCE|nr:ankyrin repeat domain-containing protein 1-like [Chelonus insularis]
MTAALIELLLQHNVDVEAANAECWTSLITACANDNLYAIKCLLDHNANIEAMDKKASDHGNCNVIQCLFDHHANVNHSGINNLTALYIAIERQSVETTECLIKCNADINLPDKENQTPLEKALKMDSSGSYPSKTVRILIFEVAKLKVAGLKLPNHNLDILHNHNVRWPRLSKESRFTKETEQMKKKNIGNNDIMLYDFLKNHICFLP